MLENTALHSVGRCLESRGQGETDVLDLLQFATQIVFCDDIVLGTSGLMVPPRVADRTGQVLDTLSSLGVERVSLSPHHVTKNQWLTCCARAATDFVEDFSELIKINLSEISDGRPESLDSGLFTARFRELIAIDRSPEEILDITRRVIQPTGSGHVGYCLAMCPPLWEAVRREFVRQEGWPTALTSWLDVLLRVYVNIAVAADLGAMYSPAVSRASLLRNGASRIEQRLTKVVSEATKKFDVTDEIAPRRLPAPSLRLALVRNTDGSAQNVLEGALSLRSKARPLRKVLTPLAAKISQGETEDEGLFDLEMTARELCRLLEEDLGLAKPSQLRDALELKFVIGVPSPSIDMKAAIKWFNDWKRRRRVAVLTDLSKSLIFRQQLGAEYDRLLRRTITAH